MGDSNADISRVWYLRLGHVLSVGQIRRPIAVGALSKTRLISKGCEVYVKTKLRKSYYGSLTKEKAIVYLNADVKAFIKDQ